MSKPDPKLPPGPPVEEPLRSFNQEIAALVDGTTVHTRTINQHLFVKCQCGEETNGPLDDNIVDSLKSFVDNHQH